jgi:hypothetical protein
MQQNNGFAVAAFRVNNLMVANLDYPAFQTGGKPFQADEHGSQVRHEYPFPSPPEQQNLRRRFPLMNADKDNFCGVPIRPCILGRSRSSA